PILTVSGDEGHADHTRFPPRRSSDLCRGALAKRSRAIFPPRMYDGMSRTPCERPSQARERKASASSSGYLVARARIASRYSESRRGFGPSPQSTSAEASQARSRGVDALAERASAVGPSRARMARAESGARSFQIG